jgi:hypothetical protein
MNEPALWWPTTMLALTINDKAGRSPMAPQSYRDRMKAARAEARVKREAERDAWRHEAQFSAEVRRLALEAIKKGIRDRGDRVTPYTPAQLQEMANAVIGPWLVAQAKARVAERKSKHLSNSQSAV